MTLADLNVHVTFIFWENMPIIIYTQGREIMSTFKLIRVDSDFIFKADVSRN